MGADASLSHNYFGFISKIKDALEILLWKVWQENSTPHIMIYDFLYISVSFYGTTAGISNELAVPIFKRASAQGSARVESNLSFVYFFGGKKFESAHRRGVLHSTRSACASPFWW